MIKNDGLEEATHWIIADYLGVSSIDVKCHGVFSSLVKVSLDFLG